MMLVLYFVYWRKSIGGRRGTIMTFNTKKLYDRLSLAGLKHKW